MERAKIVGFLPGLSNIDPTPCYKIAYSTPQEAYKVIERKQKRRGQHSNSVYRCDNCNKFHISSKIK